MFQKIFLFFEKIRELQCTRVSVIRVLIVSKAVL